MNLRATLIEAIERPVTEAEAREYGCQCADDLARVLLDRVETILRRPQPDVCTGLEASWCPVHGACTCPIPANAMDDPACPLHAPDSTHAEAG